jgi:hypothetical protein
LSVTAKNPLCTGLSQLEQALHSLSWAIVQGQPKTEQGHALADYYDEAVTEMTGQVMTAHEALDCDRKQAAGSPGFSQIRAGMITCQQNFNQLSGRFYGDLVSFERIEELNELARRKGQKWAGWVLGVKDALNQCHQPLYELSQTLLQEWIELTGQQGRTAFAGTAQARLPAEETKPGQGLRIVQRRKGSE